MNHLHSVTGAVWDNGDELPSNLGAGHLADLWKRKLLLAPMEGESGWWRTIYKSRFTRNAGGASEHAVSAIYYLLDEGRPINYWHWLASDDIHVLIDGGPVEYYVVTNGRASRHVMGRGTAKGESPVVAVPGGSYKALRLLRPDGFALMASIVAPAWSAPSLRIGPPSDLSQTAAAQKAGLNPELIDSLTTPADRNK